MPLRWPPRRGTLSLAEVSGSLGDLGTFIPLLLGLARQGSVHFVPALFFGGLFNLLTGLVWDAPMCVQPMKTIAAIGIAEGLAPAQVAAAGMLVSAMVLLLGLTRSIVLVGRLVPEPVILGMQLGLGISLTQKAFALIAGNGPARADTPGDPLAASIDGPLDSQLARHVAAAVGVCFVLVTRQVQCRLPSALILFGIGSIVSIYILVATQTAVSFSPVKPAFWVLGDLTLEECRDAFFGAALPQLPLTTLNSVISVCKLAQELTPDAKITQPSVAIAVGAMNLIGCPFGAMPCCHGAGGLAGQYAFGARRGVAVLFLGACKVALAVALGGPMLAMLGVFPDALLGVLLVFSGVELARFGARLGVLGDGGAVVGLLTAAATIKYKTGIGCLVGLCSALICGGVAATARRCQEGQFLRWLRDGDDEVLPALLVVDNRSTLVATGGDVAHSDISPPPELHTDANGRSNVHESNFEEADSNMGKRRSQSEDD